MITPKDGFTLPPVPDRDPKGAAENPRPLGPEIGSVIGGFTLEEVVGESEAGTVYRATRGGRTRALKVFRPGASPDPEVLRRLCESTFRHPNLADVEEFGEDAGIVYVTRSLLRGDSLDRILDASTDDSPPSSLGFGAHTAGAGLKSGLYRHVVGLFADVADGLHEAHEQGLIHGGIHPGNLIFSPSGRLVLTDFGEDLATGSVEPYLAPEQRADLDSEQGVPVDAGTDVYSLAAVLHRVLTGRRERPDDRDYPVAPVDPDPDPDDRDVGEDLEGDCGLSSDLRTVLSMALASDRDERYGSAAAFAGDLRRVLGLEAPQAAADPPDHDDSGEGDHDVDGLREDGRPSSAGAQDSGRASDAEDTAGGLGVSSSHSVPGEVTGEPVSIRTSEAASTSTSTAPFPDRKTERSDEPRFHFDRGGVRVGSSPPPVQLRSRANVAPLLSRPRLEGADATEKVRAENVGTDAIGERQLLFDALDPAAVPRPGWEPGRRRWLFLATSIAFVLVIVAATFLALHLHDRSDFYRSHTIRLGRSARQLIHAAVAMGDDRALQAAEALAMARESLSSVSADVGEVRIGDLSDLEARLRSVSRDPNLARLQSADVLVKAAALDAIRREVAAGERSSADLDAVAELVRYDDAGVARRAIRTCAVGKRYDELTGRFPVGRGRTTIRLSAEVFKELYQAWGEGALDGNERARESFFEVSFDSLSRLDAAIEAGTDSGADELSVPPNISVHDLADLESGDFVRLWLGVAAALDGESVLRHLPRLERREDLTTETIAALERVGGAAAVRALRRFTLSRIHRRGEEGIDALARLGEGVVLADMAFERVPIEIRSYAVRKAVALDSESGRAKIASLIQRHPEPEIRRAALEALAQPGFVAKHPAALVAALSDFYLRDAALVHLGDDLPEAAVDPLLILLETSEVDLRIRVVRVLGRSQSEAALLPLARQLRETSPRLRRETLEALADLGDDRAIPLATGLLEPGYEGLLDLARKLLEKNALDLKENRGLLVLALVVLLEIETSDSESYGLNSLRRNLLLDRLGVGHDMLDCALPPRLREALGLPPS